MGTEIDFKKWCTTCLKITDWLEDIERYHTIQCLNCDMIFDLEQAELRLIEEKGEDNKK